MTDNRLNGVVDEQKLVRLYMDLTGTSESCARSVFMYVSRENAKPAESPIELAVRSVAHESVEEPARAPAPAPRPRRALSVSP